MKHDEVMSLIRQWGSEPDSSYDFNGVVHLLIAALDNLREFALEAELEDIVDSFEPEQIEFIQRICSYCSESAGKGAAERIKTNGD